MIIVKGWFIQIREAAQAMLLAELRRIGVEGRRQVIDEWSPVLQAFVDQSHCTAAPLDHSTGWVEVTAGSREGEGGREADDDEDDEDGNKDDEDSLHVISEESID